MNRRSTSTVAGAVVTATVLIVLDVHDFSQDPPTDRADVVATAAALGGAIVWFAVHKLASNKPGIQVLGALAAGVAIGAILIGLVSVMYDPWAS